MGSVCSVEFSCNLDVLPIFDAGLRTLLPKSGVGLGLPLVFGVHEVMLYHGWSRLLVLLRRLALHFILCVTGNRSTIPYSESCGVSSL